MAFESLAPLLNRLPAVTRPEGHVHFKKKLGWTLGILVLYFVLANIPLFGLDKSSIDLFELYRAFFAGASGSLMVLGIGPIVTASIVLQLLVGANVIKMDLTDPHQQAIFQGLQKLLVFVMIALEALPQILGGFMKADAGLAATLGVDVSFITLLLFLQVCMGGVLILYMDEIVSKWGIGSGVGLFIIAGVSQQIVQGLFNWNTDETGVVPIGIIPKWIYMAGPTSGIDLNYIVNNTVPFLYNAGILALFSTIGIYLMVVYVESTRIEIPLAHAAVRGARGRFPVKLIYASVLPMILVRALQANIQMIGLILSSKGITTLGIYARDGTPVGGLMYFLSPINGPSDWIPSLVGPRFTSLGFAEPALWKILLHVFTDASMLIIGGIIFALFWVETTGMGAKQVAAKIQKSGMQIPGYRRSSGTLERVMQRYVPKVTVIGGAFIGILTLIASLLGTLGGAGGTGLLLTVSIMYRLYEDIASQQMMEMHPMMRSFFGKE
ncbi:MAG: protein translocase subunit secY/sec61 alpha [Candidatus Methanoperedens nitroreducens]|uniref:Protein translocase subunit SecY n=1 Tax=Candidatus Methanoperedens nitratireducens TaxID=1392998 RepID=A0A0N8KQS9_9EURY|nr:preprotein translocase subunit SecY [Candidatus Methanoperedens sp. BLZ2]KAB2945682.1 MAG: preprotein translocase subunit SecY [Candidatus Methanoperedens sp.]KPQ42986.1 MAG: protein translocase subunit secY/sec61 alpha [Candidatus Methanoperedens sp. BLZ1]MBZ0177310.1 preprotein translocase subunit SecY [Candidatus Methanoperedens nitroreducens]MCX9076812.1 preprotein translocase subunit SecY [Candidatus Methanoperedens sp.]